MEQKNKKHLKPDLRVNYHGFSSDHIPFLDRDIPAVLLIDRDNMMYADRFGHTSADALGNIDWQLARDSSQVAADTVLNLALEQ